VFGKATKTLTIAGLVLAMVAIPACVQAQLNIPDVYQVGYFSNLTQNTPAQRVRIINTGQTGVPNIPGLPPQSGDEGVLCANLYVFDANQHMLACCACPLTANAVLDFNVGTDLITNLVTGGPRPTDGAIKLVSSRQTPCDVTNPVPVPDLRAFGTRVQLGVAALRRLTETEFLPANLRQDELTYMSNSCTFVQLLGSGQGVCRCPGVR